MAAMERNGLVQEGQSTNAKVEQDVRNLLTANGLPGDTADVYIVDPDNHETPFDLDDEDNELKLFELRVELDYGSISGLSMSEGLQISAAVVFRNGRAVLAQ